MDTTEIKLLKSINGNLQINITPLSDEYLIVVNYQGCSYVCFDVSLFSAFDRINLWIEKVEIG